MIDNQIYVVEDKGGAIKGNIIDMYIGTEQESINYGRQTKEVFIKEE